MVIELLRRRFHEIARWSNQRPTDAAMHEMRRDPEIVELPRTVGWCERIEPRHVTVNDGDKRGLVADVLG